MPQCRELVERHPFGGLHVEVLLQLAKKLGLFDAVDAQVGFQIGVEVDHFGRIAGLLDNEVDQKGFQARRRQAFAGRLQPVRSAASRNERLPGWRFPGSAMPPTGGRLVAGRGDRRLSGRGRAFDRKFKDVP